ncbi:MAG: hypothetical protein H0U53_08770 [Actinobacteria bacterium]|nr:hypothetical protein [Actinomycetota bacterium]
MPSADDVSLARLLALQTEDSANQRLAARRASLPEAERLKELDEVLAELRSDHEIAQSQFDEVNRQNLKLEGEIELIDAKITREEQRMFSGAVTNSKELSALQAEVESLKRKKSTIEDSLLEIMEQRESTAATLERLTQERDVAEKESAELTRTVDGLISDIDAETSEHEKARGEIAGLVPGDLLDLYEKIREVKGGVGAAALSAGTCQGCHTKIPQKELERIRAEGGLQRCDNCRRILVTT